MDYEIRSLSTPELEQAAMVVRRGFSTVAKEFKLTRDNCPANNAFMRTERLVIDSMRGDLMFGLFADGEMAGFVQIERTSREITYLKRLSVLPEFRHRGFGRALLRFAVQRAAEWGAHQLEASIIEDNLRLRDWYLENGFIMTGIKTVPSLPFRLGKLMIPLKQEIL